MEGKKSKSKKRSTVWIFLQIIKRWAGRCGTGSDHTKNHVKCNDIKNRRGNTTNCMYVSNVKKYIRTYISTGETKNLTRLRKREELKNWQRNVKGQATLTGMAAKKAKPDTKSNKLQNLQWW